MQSKKTAVVLLAVAALGCACSILPERAPPQKIYDLGVAPAPARLAKVDFPARMVLGKVGAAAWLQNNNIYYRFAYLDTAQLRSYSRSRWLANPAKLLGQQIQTALTEAAPPCEDLSRCAQLNLTIQRMEQVFTGPHSAHVLLQVRASLSGPDQQRLLAQRVFHLRGKSKTADAAGAIAGFRAVSRRLLPALARWLQGLNGSRDRSGHARSLGLLGQPQ